MADNFGGSENIYYDESSNIVLIDPNAVRDSSGVKKDRVIKQENLIMYANLEAKAVPRTKLAVGQDVESSVNNTTVASINFLKPNDKNSFDTSYTDESTGAGSSQGRGINQIKFNNGQNPQQNNYVDTQILGIRDINVDIKFNGVPTVTMTLVDVQGKSLFQTGGNSPYSVFLYYPYPLFELTLKGFYGKAIKYELMLLNFQASFEASTGNYIVNLKFIARTSAMLDDIRLGYLFALPHMYNQYSIPNTPTVNTSNSATASVQQDGTGITTEVTVESPSKGYSKIKQVFDEYKRRGLIDQNVPAITLNEMSIRLTKYTEFLNKEFDKLDFTNIVALERYKGSLNNFSNKIVRWGETYLDSTKVLVLNNSFKNIKLYQLKQLTNSPDGTEIKSNIESSLVAEKELNATLETGLKEFNSVPTDICKSITLDQKAFNVNFFKEKFSVDDINFEDTYFKQRGRQITNPNTDVEYIKFKNNLISELQNNGTLLKVEPSGEVNITTGNLYYYTLDKEIETIKNINGQIVQKYKEESERLNQVLKDKVRTNGNVQDLQFRPTVRNVVGSIMASVDAFYQLMDDVHTNAWNQRNNTARLKSILTTNPSQEGKNTIQTTTTQNQNYFVYPWPQFVQKKETSGKVEYEVTYPGSKATSESTQAYNPSIWPEVEFVEEYLKGVLEKDRNFTTDIKPNTSLIVKYTPEHAIEVPFRTDVYNQQNNSAVNYVYEMYERLYLNAFYSGLFYIDVNQDIVFTASDVETNNVVQSLPSGDLKNIITNTLPTTTLYNYLKTTAGENQAGPLWQTFISQNFVTPYINEQVNNSWKLLSPKDFNATSTNPLKLKSLDNIKSVLSANTTNATTLFDTYPFIIDSFAQKMQDTPNKDNRYITINSYGFNDKKLVIDNFSGPSISPLTRTTTSNAGYLDTQTTNQLVINFYEDRYGNKLKKFYTEGNLTYTTDTNLTITQTTSLLNTPYFINAIVEAGNTSGNDKYTKLGYLLLNSLPLATLHEKYINTTNGVTTEYIFANLNKFSAIHELPYAWILKMGSIWYRYKNYIENNTDILTSIWKDFDYKTNYDPITSAATKTYDIVYGSANSGKRPFTLLGSNNIQTGFYPQVINNFYKILTNNDLFIDSTGSLTYDLNNTTVLFGNELVLLSNNENVNKVKGPINSWYSYLNITADYSSYFGPQYQGYKCLFPSAGVQPFQQSYNELRGEGNTTDITVSEISNSNPMYNGSVKTFWNAPNYGWFDNTQVEMPTPFEYLKYVRTGTTENQPDFDITSTYSSIEDLFGVFTKDQLDSFETEFKEFCKTDGESKIFSPEGDDTTYANIVNLFKKMFLVKDETTVNNTSLGNLQASNINDVLSKFIDIKVYFKNGNPKKFDRQQFGYFSKNTQFKPVQDFNYGGQYVSFYPNDPNPLPSVGGKTVSESKTVYPEVWKTLQEYVGFSTIGGIEYTLNSTVYDFFRDNQIPFTSDNIKGLYPLIRIYATQKKLDSTYDPSRFASDITSILNKAETKRNSIEQQFRGKLPSSLAGQKQEQTQNVDSKLDGDIIKLEQWELFKAVNDKWVAGRDTKNRLLFDEFLFFDKANRDIGDELIINTDTIRKYCNWDNSSNSVMSLIRQIVADNRMNFFVMPAYINFYGKSSLRTTDRNVSILNNANDVFSTFTYVDYIDSAPKFLCQYVDRPSQTLSLDNDPNYPFKSDSFDLGNPTNNPIIEKGPINQHNSNKAVGFVVDFGTMNQSIFKSVDINQEQGVTSSEQIQTTIDMGNQGSGKKTMQQTTSLYDFYKNRSYSSTVKTLGNVMIQPTMYFVLRHMPMFNGTYIIRNVKHTISPGSFNTEFNGQRVSANINTKVSEDLASVNEDFSKKLSDKVKQFVSNNTLVTYDSNSKQYLTGDQSKNYVLSAKTPYQGFIVQTTDLQTQDCGENVNAIYGAIENSNLITSSITVNNLVTLISNSTTDTNLRTYLFSMLYMMGNKTDITSRLQYKQNNLYGVIVDVAFPGGLKSKITKYRCLKTGENFTRPFATFDNLQENINFVRDFYSQKMSTYFTDGLSKEETINKIIELFYVTWYSSGTLTQTYTQNSNYNTWLGNVRWAYQQAKTLGLY